MADTLPDETLHQGEARDLVVTVTDDDDEPVDLSGADLHYRVAETAGGAALLSVDEPTITVTGAGNNVVTIPRSGAQTAALGAHAHYHELYRSDTDTVLAKGTGLLIVASQLAAHE